MNAPIPLPMTLQASPIDKLIAEIAIAIESWSEDQTKSIAGKVHARLDQHRDEVLMKLMGFDKDYRGAWQIDHCNGRAGNSPISDFLKSSQEAAVRNWLSEIKLPAMSPAFKKKIEKDLQHRYESELNSLLYSMAKQKAQEHLTALLDQALKPTLVEPFLKAQALINTAQSTTN